MKRKIAIQGVLGSNHYIASISIFKNGKLEFIDCDTFKYLARLVKKDPTVLGVMAIENTIVGSILPNYNLIKENDLVIVGEYKLRIEHALVAMKGVEISQIREINSHPMALMQCEEYLESLPNIKIVEKEDTADSARWIKTNGLKEHAAICPAACAEIYDMQILANGIETSKRNFTRFLILANKTVAKQILRELHYDDNSDDNYLTKSSLVFTLPHSSGSLSKVLSILSFYDMNLTMIQSLPLVGEEWHYQFFINLSYSDYDRYRKAIDAILPLCKEFKILGEYN